MAGEQCKSVTVEQSKPEFQSISHRMHEVGQLSRKMPYSYRSRYATIYFGITAHSDLKTGKC